MSDFLTRLAQRTLGTTVVQPRLPPMFTVDGDTSRPPPAHDWEPEQSSNQSRDQPRRHTRQIVEAAAEPSRASSVKVGTVLVQQGPETDSRSRPATTRDELPARDPTSAAVESRSSNMATIDTATDAESAAAATPTPVTRISQVQVVPRSEPSSASGSAAPSPAMPARVVRAGDPEPSREVDSPGPVVRVTIGRVEIRAIHPPASPPRRAPAPLGPRLTLEEYLRQRSKARDE